MGKKINFEKSLKRDQGRERGDNCSVSLGQSESLMWEKQEGWGSPQGDMQCPWALLGCRSLSRAGPAAPLGLQHSLPFTSQSNKMNENLKIVYKIMGHKLRFLPGLGNVLSISELSVLLQPLHLCDFKHPSSCSQELP